MALSRWKNWMIFFALACLERDPPLAGKSADEGKQRSIPESAATLTPRVGRSLSHSEGSRES